MSIVDIALLILCLKRESLESGRTRGWTERVDKRKREGGQKWVFGGGDTRGVTYYFFCDKCVFGLDTPPRNYHLFYTDTLLYIGKSITWIVLIPQGVGGSLIRGGKRGLGGW